jgi:ribosomal protein S18 acetylase RimI-like enzyme
VESKPGDVEQAAAARTALAERGVHVRVLDPARFDDELRLIFELSLAAFAANRYYSPVGWERFRAMYTALGPLIDPELVLLAESDAGELLGLCFSYTDPLTRDGRPRVILKTLAVAPHARGLGLGGALTMLTQGVAASRGADVIHALMEAGNPSRRISSSQGGKPIRRYVLYEAPGTV